MSTYCDHPARLKFSHTLPMAFTEHGAIRAATVLNSPHVVSMNAFVEPPPDSTARRIGFQSKAKA